MCENSVVEFESKVEIHARLESGDDDEKWETETVCKFLAWSWVRFSFVMLHRGILRRWFVRSFVQLQDLIA